MKKILLDTFDTHPLAEAAATYEHGLDVSQYVIEPFNGKFKLFELVDDDARSILDDDTHYCKVDLLKHIDDNHLIKRLSLSVADATDLPKSTVFLNGLGVFSSMACRQWRVSRQYGGSIPIGLYVITEQPSGTGKSYSLDAFQKPFFELYKKSQIELRDQLDNATDNEKERILKLLKIKSFVTDATPEALDVSLVASKGFFSAVSSEQQLINSLLGLSYGDGKRASNNDLFLNGSDGGFVSGLRNSREAFIGKVAGGFVCFAQDGSVQKILAASNGIGVSERVLMIAEHHNLGKRDFERVRKINDDFVSEYAETCNRLIDDVFMNPKELSDLRELTITPEGWQLINKARNRIEPHLADGGKYSHISLRGAAGKIDMQIMKIAANLQLLANKGRVDIDAGTYPEQWTINNDFVQSAIWIATDLLDAQLVMLGDKGLIGAKAEWQAIINYLSNKKKATMNEIKNSLKATQPFKSLTSNRAKSIENATHEMLETGILNLSDDGFYSVK